MLVVPGKGGQRVVALNHAARQSGLVVGDLLSNARSKVLTLQVRDADPAADAEALRKLALWALRYTPTVATWDALSGAADVSLQVRGALASPAVTGSLRSSGARLVDSRSGIALDGMSADVSLAGGRATIRSLTGTLSTSGSLSASGSVGIEPGQGLPADLTIRISDARYTDGRLVTTTMNGDLAAIQKLNANALQHRDDFRRIIVSQHGESPIWCDD